MLRIKTQEKFNRIYETESEILKPNTASNIHPLKVSQMLRGYKYHKIINRMLIFVDKRYII